MNDPAMWICWDAGGNYRGTCHHEEDARRWEKDGTTRRAVRYLPESHQPPIALCSGEPCTVLTTSYYERILADAEKWLVVERMVKGEGT